MPSFRLHTFVPATVPECFDRSLSVDAHTASMRHSGERAIAGVTSGVMGAGDTVTWRACHFGLPFTMTSRISVYEPPNRFVDEPVSGPFRRWWHEHRFAEVDGGTSMTDVVEFTAPFGPVGRTVERLVLVRYMTDLLRRRNQWLAASFTA